MDKMLPLMRQALGRSVSAIADKAGFNPPLHDMLCVANIKETNLKPHAMSVKPYLNLFHAGFVIATDERDFAEVLEVAGMPAIMVETLQRDIRLAFITGSLSQWKDAIVRGCISSVGKETRHIYNQVYLAFSKLGLSAAFELTLSPERPDKTYLIEYKRG